MKQKADLIAFFESPLYQAVLVLCFIIVLSLIDMTLSHDSAVIHPKAGPWMVSTALILCYIFFNTLFLFRIAQNVSYWSKSVISYVLLLILAYGWCYLLSGMHIDDVGSFRWLWIVLTLVYMIFFAIAYTIKGIIAIADKEEGR
jgi:hypothetical protein